MILPNKHLESERSLVAIGATILTALPGPRTVTSVWQTVQPQRQALTFERFALALSFLYAIGAVEMDNDLLRRAHQ